MEEMGHRSQGAKGLIAPCDVSWPCWLTAPLASIVRDDGFGKYVHHRELYPVDAPIVRPNRDTLYSFSNFDLDAGPVTITLPDARQRFMSLQVISLVVKHVEYGVSKTLSLIWSSPSKSEGLGMEFSI
jgi:hypothetical protein